MSPCSCNCCSGDCKTCSCSSCTVSSKLFTFDSFTFFYVVLIVLPALSQLTCPLRRRPPPTRQRIPGLEYRCFRTSGIQDLRPCVGDLLCHDYVYLLLPGSGFWGLLDGVEFRSGRETSCMSVFIGLKAVQSILLEIILYCCRVITLSNTLDIIRGIFQGCIQCLRLDFI